MPKIAQHTADTSVLDQKQAAKAALQKRMGWAAEPKRAIICLPTGLTKALGGELFEDVIEGLLSLPVEIVVLGKGSSGYGEIIQKYVAEHSHRMGIIPNAKEDVQAMYLGADMALFLTDPSINEELAICLAHGIVPISPTSKMLQQYNPVQEAGTSFIYDKLTHWHCFAAVVRALETFIFPFDWKTIQKQCVRSVMGEG